VIFIVLFITAVVIATGAPSASTAWRRLLIILAVLWFFTAACLLAVPGLSGLDGRPEPTGTYALISAMLGAIFLAIGFLIGRQRKGANP